MYHCPSADGGEPGRKRSGELIYGGRKKKPCSRKRRTAASCGEQQHRECGRGESGKGAPGTRRPPERFPAQKGRGHTGTQAQAAGGSGAAAPSGNGPGPGTGPDPAWKARAQAVRQGGPDHDPGRYLRGPLSDAHCGHLYQFLHGPVGDQRQLRQGLRDRHQRRQGLYRG